MSWAVDKGPATGTPASGRPAQPYTAESEAGNVKALKHGATRAQLPDDEVADAIQFLFGTDTADWPLPARRTAELAAQMWVRRQRAVAYVDRVGMFRDDGSSEPALKLIDGWERQILRILEQHGGTPQSMANLQKTQAMARALQRPALTAALDQLDALELDAAHELEAGSDE